MKKEDRKRLGLIIIIFTGLMWVSIILGYLFNENIKYQIINADMFFPVFVTITTLIVGIIFISYKDEEVKKDEQESTKQIPKSEES